MAAIHRAVTYCQSLIAPPAETIFVLISDLIEGGNKVAGSGVNMINLLALDDSGAPCFDQEVAGTFTSLGVPSLASTPDLFPNAIQRRDIGQWAATQGIEVERGERRCWPKPRSKFLSKGERFVSRFRVTICDKKRPTKPHWMMRKINLL